MNCAFPKWVIYFFRATVSWCVLHLGLAAAGALGARDFRSAAIITLLYCYAIALAHFWWVRASSRRVDLG